MKAKILILDDEPLITESLSEYLQLYDYDAIGVVTFEEALKMSENTKFDLYIVDIKLKKYDGIKAILKLYKLNPTTKFIIFTGSRTFKVPEEFKELNITDKNVIFKPLIDLNIMLKKIEEILQDKK